VNAPNTRSPWTPAKDAQLAELRSLGRTHTHAARVLGVTRKAVLHRADKLWGGWKGGGGRGRRDIDREVRPCLSGGGPVWTHWRLCDLIRLRQQGRDVEACAEALRLPVEMVRMRVATLDHSSDGRLGYRGPKEDYHA
jgi:hypothetical protein